MKIRNNKIFNYVYVIFTAVAAYIMPLYGYAVTNDASYIRVTEAMAPSAIAPVPAGDINLVTVDYVDGLGRPVQKVLAGRSPDAYDIATAALYDRRGAIEKEYLPVEMNTADGDYTIGDMDSYAKTFYNDSRPYKQSIYDDTAEPRLKCVKGPGALWEQHDRNIKKEYAFCGEMNDRLACTLYDVDTEGRLVNRGLYREGMLEAVIATDENNNVSVTFSDRDGRTVSVRRIDGNGSFSDTHWVFDECGRLRYMISPKAAELLRAQGICDASVIDKLCYKYRYDDRNRLTEKKLPGVEPVYFVYDRMNRVIFSQDGVDRINGQWRVSKYDAKMRIAIEGIARMNGATRVSLQNQYGNSLLVEKSEPEKGYDGMLFYSDNAGPAGFTAHRAYFYDDYRHWGGVLPTDANYQTVYEGINSNGMLTGTAALDFGAGGIIITAAVYDDKGSVVMTAEKDFYADYSNVSFFRNSFRGKPFKKKRMICFGSEGVVNEKHTEEWNYSYDNAERLVSVMHRYGDNQWKTLTENSYDGIGRVVRNSYGTNIYAPDNRVNKVGYNIRGWITTQAAPFFSQSIYYENPGLSGTPQYNGNVSAMNVSMSFPGQYGGMVQRDYGAAYGYDTYDRLTETSISSDNGILYNSLKENIEYDLNGNVTSIIRGNGDYMIQDMVIDYDGNRISNIWDGASGENVDNVPVIPEGNYPEPYGYDANGNVIRDSSRGIASVLYSPVNLPQKIEFADGNRIWYAHRADGVKTMRRNETRRVTTTVKVNSKGDTIRTDRVTYDMMTRQFFGDLVREDGKTKRIYNEAGYIEFDASKAPVYYFHVKDYLGSTRAVIDISGNLVQGTDYYAGGLPVVPFGSPLNAEERLHTGKEFNAFNGLGWYDNAARSYDAIIPRFLQQDPLAEKYPHLSPYVSCANNPLKFTDPDGRDAQISIDGDNITIKANIILTGNNKSQELANTYQQGINDTWGQINTFDYKGKTYNVTWDVNVSIAAEGQDAQRDFNGINNYMNVLDPNSDGASSVSNMNRGEIRSGNMGTSDLKSSNPMPHEFGHMLGLSDKYMTKNPLTGAKGTDYGKVLNPKWEGDIMAMKSGAGNVTSKTMGGVLAKPLKMNSIINPTNSIFVLKVIYYINKNQREEENNKF